MDIFPTDLSIFTIATLVPMLYLFVYRIRLQNQKRAFCQHKVEWHTNDGLQLMEVLRLRKMKGKNTIKIEQKILKNKADLIKSINERDKIGWLR